MRRTIGAAVTLALLGTTAAIHSAGHAQNAASTPAAPEDCEWRKQWQLYVLFCRYGMEPIDPEDAESDAMLAGVGIHRVRPPEWSESQGPFGFDHTTVDRANGGDVAAMRMVGMFHYADGTTAKAVPWFQKAALAGDVEAARHLGMMYEWGLAVPRDHAKARDWFVLAAGRGDLWAMHWLGELYLSGGKDLPKNPTEAARWLREAADGGDAAAMFRVAELSKDPAESQKWLERSASAGFEPAGAALKRRGLPVPTAMPVAPITPPPGPPPECKLPDTLKGSPITDDLTDLDNERTAALMAGGFAGEKDAAFCLSRRAALRGSGYAAIDLAGAYSTSRAGPPGARPRTVSEDKVFALTRDDAESLRWLALATQSTDQYMPGQAMEDIGDHYASGIGVARNDVEAVRWYRRALAVESFGAPMALAYMLHGGFGVLRDEREAMKLLRDDIGFASNRALYGAMIANGMAPLDDIWTAEALGLAAEAGYVEAMLRFGRMLAQGQGYPKDLHGARRVSRWRCRWASREARKNWRSCPRLRRTSAHRSATSCRHRCRAAASRARPAPCPPRPS